MPKTLNPPPSIPEKVYGRVDEDVGAAVIGGSVVHCCRHQEPRQVKRRPLLRKGGGASPVVDKIFYVIWFALLRKRTSSFETFIVSKWNRGKISGWQKVATFIRNMFSTYKDHKSPICVRYLSSNCKLPFTSVRKFFSLQKKKKQAACSCSQLICNPPHLSCFWCSTLCHRGFVLCVSVYVSVSPIFSHAFIFFSPPLSSSHTLLVFASSFPCVLLCHHFGFLLKFFPFVPGVFEETISFTKTKPNLKMFAISGTRGSSGFGSASSTWHQKMVLYGFTGQGRYLKWSEDRREVDWWFPGTVGRRLRR